MVKRKVKLKLIDDVVSRKVCYKKRMKGLWKKMDQLTTLCDVEACAIITGPGDKSPRIWPSRDVAEELQQKSVGKNMMVDQRKYMLEKTEKLEAKLAELKKKNNESEMSILMHHIHHGSKSISDLDPAQLKRLLSYVKEKQKLVQMKININNNLSRDPQMLSPPNHPLQNVIDDDSSSINSRSDELNVDPNNINAVDVDMMTSAGFDSTSKFGGLINGLSGGSGVFGSLNYYNGDHLIHLHQLIDDDDDDPLLSGLMTLTSESEGDFIIGSRPPPNNNNIDQENSSVLLLPPPAAADHQGNFIISNTTTTAAAAGNSTCYSATNRGYNLGGGVWDGNNNFLTNNYYNNIDICPSYYCGNYNIINVVGSGSGSGSRIGGSTTTDMTTNYFELAAGGSSSTTVRGNQKRTDNSIIGGGGGGGSWCSFGTPGAADTVSRVLDTNCSSFIDNNTTTDQGYLPSAAAASQGYLGSSNSTGGDHDDTDQVAAAASTSFPGINSW